MSLVWTNPHAVDTRRGVGFLYFARLVDPTTTHEHRYIGQSRRGESRLRDYRRNVERIFAGLPRRSTRGQEMYRLVHLAMAKACEHGWEYEFYPLENCDCIMLNEYEQRRIIERQCDLNAKRSWAVADYPRLTLAELLAKI
jgi:hypothetical protein